MHISTHLPLHLVDLWEGEHAVADDRPRLVRVYVVADDLRREHERSYEQTMARGASRRRKSDFEALQDVECGECNARMEPGAIESVGDKVCERRGQRGERRHGERR